MALFASGGKLLTAGAGKLASSSGCCCKPKEDPDRIVRCCFNGVCADITAAECAFLGGQVLLDCESCVPTQPPTTSSTNCIVCCDSNDVEELDALVSVYVSDPFCGGTIGQGCSSTRHYGRLGESLVGQAQITLQRVFAGGCEWMFGGCFPLGQIGNFTEFGISIAFSVQRSDGGSVGFPSFLGCSGNACECRFSVTSFSAAVSTCGFPENFFQVFCTTPASGGRCSAGISVPFQLPSYAAATPGICKGAASFNQERVITWSDFLGGCFTTNTGLLVTGTPKTRDIGNVECGDVDYVFTGETTHTVRTRVAVTIL